MQLHVGFQNIFAARFNAFAFHHIVCTQRVARDINLVLFGEPLRELSECSQRLVFVGHELE